MNVQYAVKKEDGRPVVYVLEVNPRASRTVPFVSKATGMPLAKVAAKVMVGVSLAEQGYHREPDPRPRLGQGGRLPLRQVRRRGHRARAGDEIDRRGDGHQRAVLDRLRQEPAGRRHGAARAAARSSSAWPTGPRSTWSAWPGGWRRWASSCWPPAARPSGWKRPASSVQRLKKLQEGHPNVLDYMVNGDLRLVMNTPSGKGARTDEGRIRAAAVSHGIPCITTIQAADAAVLAMEALRQEEMTVQAVQDRFPKPAKE